MVPTKTFVTGKTCFIKKKNTGNHQKLSWGHTGKYKRFIQENLRFSIPTVKDCNGIWATCTHTSLLILMGNQEGWLPHVSSSQSRDKLYLNEREKQLQQSWKSWWIYPKVQGAPFLYHISTHSKEVHYKQSSPWPWLLDPSSSEGISSKYEDVSKKCSGF